MNISEKLQLVQEKLKAPKTQFNKFGNYPYRNCEDIQEAVKPLLKEVKTTLVVGDEPVLVGERYYIKATARFIDCESQECITNTAYAREELDKKGMDASQITGSTSSYARKYALNGLFCIDDMKDADNQDNAAGGKKTGADTAGKSGSVGKSSPDLDVDKHLNERIDQAKLNVIHRELKRIGRGEDVVLGLFHLKSIEEVTNSQFDTVMKKFKATPTKET